MADSLSLEDRAQLMAEGLGIIPGAYAGRTRDAIVAMVLVKAYPRMVIQDQHSILVVIAEKMGFQNSNPAFVNQCRFALALMIANPAWVPGSLSNSDLEQEVAFWRGTSEALHWLGFTGGGYIAAKSKSVLGEIGRNFETVKPGAKPGLQLITGPFKSAITPGVTSGILILGLAAKIIADSCVRDLEEEATRRGQLGSMSPLTASRFGTQAP